MEFRLRMGPELPNSTDCRITYYRRGGGSRGQLHRGKKTLNSFCESLEEPIRNRKREREGEREKEREREREREREKKMLEYRNIYIYIYI